MQQERRPDCPFAELTDIDSARLLSDPHLYFVLLPEGLKVCKVCGAHYVERELPECKSNAQTEREDSPQATARFASGVGHQDNT